MTVGKVFCLSVLCLAAATASFAAERPVTVSPGSAATVEATAAHCPTFSWGGVAGAEAYELVVYELKAAPSADSLPAEPPALRVSVPGAASSWTPPADRCLAYGTPYAWFVRAVGAKGAAGDWSRGAMFRTPEAPAELREEVLRVVRSYLAASAAPGAAPTLAAPGVAEGAASAASAGPASSPLPGPRQVEPDPAAEVALEAEHPGTIGNPTFGVYGISNSTVEHSAGVLGYLTATSGESGGVVGINKSTQGFGVMGANSATDGGVGVMARDDATSGITAGIVGLSNNDTGYAGFFWHEGDSGGYALAVADPENHPTSVDVKWNVDTDGNVETVGNVMAEGNVESDSDVVLGGVVAFTPTDSPPGCDSGVEGSIYYDTTEKWLGICTETGAGPVCAVP